VSGAWDSSHGPARAWRAGAWSLELRDDELADIAYDGVVLLRAVRAVVRDRNWDTAATLVDAVGETDGSLELHVRSAGLGSSFAGTVRVAAHGRELLVECDLRSADDFETNRTGLVVLHPPSLAGTDLEVTTASGRERSRFPRAISPHQPVLRIAGLRWQQAGLGVRLDFEGDVFEMEDQRNWTDASFKTYSRPLALPFPYAVVAGEHVRQTLRLEVGGTRLHPGSEPVFDRIELRASGSRFPRIGTSASAAPDPAPPGTGPTGPLLVELDLATANWRAALGRAVASGAELDVRFVLDDAHPDAVRDAAASIAGLPVVRVTAFHAVGPAAHVSDGAAVDALRAALSAAGVDAPVVGGVRSHFTQLNREHHRLPDGLAGIVFSITPLFHSLGTEQLVESVAMQRLVAEQAVALAAGAPVHVGPITLRPHLNDVATTPPPMPEHDDLRAGYGVQLIGSEDPRQSSPELSAWTVASAAALSIPGVATLSYFEDWGPRGIRSAEGVDLPVADAIDALRRLEGGALLTGESPDGLLWAVGVHREGADELLVANLDRRDRTLVVSTPGGELQVTLQQGSFEHHLLRGGTRASTETERGRTPRR
jgi:hypothetical protein